LLAELFKKLSKFTFVQPLYNLLDKNIIFMEINLLELSLFSYANKF
jgi:hypothetical protein